MGKGEGSTASCSDSPHSEENGTMSGTSTFYKPTRGVTATLPSYA